MPEQAPPLSLRTVERPYQKPHPVPHSHKCTISNNCISNKIYLDHIERCTSCYSDTETPASCCWSLSRNCIGDGRNKHRQVYVRLQCTYFIRLFILRNIHKAVHPSSSIPTSAGQAPHRHLAFHHCRRSSKMRHRHDQNTNQKY